MDYDGHRPLRLLWIGSVILRKGIQYLVQACRELAKRVDVRVAGPIGIAASEVDASPENMRFLGQVPRTETRALFEWVDVFVLPTLSDGFAITQLEAMGHGLPVVTTRCCGEVVTDHEDGLLVAAGDAAALAAGVERLCRSAGLVTTMSRET